MTPSGRSKIREIINWVEDGDGEYEDFVLAQSEADSLPSETEPSSSFESTPENVIPPIPDQIPILPTRGQVIYPQTVVPLTIGLPGSIRLVDDVTLTEQRLIGLVTSKNPELESPTEDDLYRTGVLATLVRMFRAPDGTIRILVQGLQRFEVREFTQREPYFKANVTPRPEIIEEGLEVEALARNARDQFEHIGELITSIPRELVSSVVSIEDPLQTAYTIANFQRMDLADGQAILEIDSTLEKLHKLVNILTRETEVLDLGQKIQNDARSEIDKLQREYYLREQLKAIQRELGESDGQVEDIANFRQKIETAHMPEEADTQARRELDRLSHLPTAAAEYGVIRTYLDWLVNLPWSKTTEDQLDIANARAILNEDHYGLDDIKDRILEFLAVRKLRRDRSEEFTSSASTDHIRRERESIILCFIGPPGVGKTSLGQSVARALGRNFVRISLGGVRDEAEIRGHRRTYIGAMPGRIIQALRRTETRSPVFMLDEIDKLTSDFHGDPSSALLEVLDPEQNLEFRDNYIEVAFDLSKVMFITTANSMETIPLPLLDRMEVIQLAGYTEGEKLQIAIRYLIPRQFRENGLRADEISLSEEAVLTLIRKYTREAGVRNLERQIGSVCRKAATLLIEGKPVENPISTETVHRLLGHAIYLGSEEIMRRTALPGVATGLAWTPAGGDVLFIEATQMPGSKGFTVTGSIGNVMQESAHAALSYVRSNSTALGLEPGLFEKIDLHMHVPAGAQPKDGPSAGITMATALVSLLTKRMVRPDVGMTGEITLTGQVLPIGGLKEKVLAAHRYGLKTIIFPRQNEVNLEQIPDDVRKDITFIPVDNIRDVLSHALETSSQPTVVEEY